MGLAVRALILPLGPRYGSFTDHTLFARWGLQAAEDGLSTVYDHPPRPWPAQRWSGERFERVQADMDFGCNYPPGAVYLLYLSAASLTALSPERLLNSLASRAVFEAWAIGADFLLAWGCAALVSRYRPGRAAAWTYAVVLLAPPFWLDSALWGQMDSVLLAPLVWTIWALLGRRWILAGLLFGLAAAFKPQAVLLAPAWLLVLLTARPFWKPLVSAAVAALLLIALSLPFTLHSGASWWNASYVQNLTTAYSNQATLSAFNIWYADLLVTDSNDAGLLRFGLNRTTWGNLLLGAMLAGGLIHFVRQRGDPRSLVLWTFVSLLACVMLPTRVHERYLLLALPFMAVACAVLPRLWSASAVLMLVATAQCVSPLWLRTLPGAWNEFKVQKTAEYAEAITRITADQQASAPALDTYLQFWHTEFLKWRGETAAWEWTLALLAIAASAAAVVIAMRSTSIAPAPNR
jgi:Gpi18-like mannosyltransferase